MYEFKWVFQVPNLPIQRWCGKVGLAHANFSFHSIPVFGQSLLVTIVAMVCMVHIEWDAIAAGHQITLTLMMTSSSASSKLFSVNYGMSTVEFVGQYRIVSFPFPFHSGKKAVTNWYTDNVCQIVHVPFFSFSRFFMDCKRPAFLFAQDEFSVISDSICKLPPRRRRKTELNTNKYYLNLMRRNGKKLEKLQEKQKVCFESEKDPGAAGERIRGHKQTMREMVVLVFFHHIFTLRNNNQSLFNRWWPWLTERRLLHGLTCNQTRSAHIYMLG